MVNVAINRSPVALLEPLEPGLKVLPGPARAGFSFIDSSASQTIATAGQLAQFWLRTRDLFNNVPDQGSAEVASPRGHPLTIFSICCLRGRPVSHMRGW